MWGRLWIAALGLAACYAPSVPSGTPCEPAAGCPFGLVCAIVDGAHVCVETAPPLDSGPPPPVDGELPTGWQIIQTIGAEADRVVELAATGEGSRIFVGIESGAGAFANDVKDNAGNSYDRINNSRARNLDRDFGVEIWHSVTSHGGASKVEVNGGLVQAVVVWEVAGLAPANAVDAAARADNQAASTQPSGAAITTTAPGELVISIVLVANAIDNVVAGSPFTNDVRTNGNGWAHLTASDAPAGTYQAQWTQPTAGVSCASSVAFRSAADP